MPLLIIGLAGLIYHCFFRRPRQEVILVTAPPKPGITITDARKSYIDILYPWAVAFWIGYFAFYLLNK